MQDWQNFPNVTGPENTVALALGGAVRGKSPQLVAAAALIVIVQAIGWQTAVPELH